MNFNWYIGMITHPVDTVRDLIEARPLGLGLVTLFLMTLITSLIQVSGLDSDAMTSDEFIFPEITIGLVATLSFITAAFWIPIYALFAFIPHFFAKVYGGSIGTYQSYLPAAAMTTFIMLLGALISAVVWIALSGNENVANIISTVVSIATSIWGLVLWFYVIRENYRLTNGGAFLTAATSIFVGFFAFFIFFIFLIFVLGVILIPFGLEINM